MPKRFKKKKRNTSNEASILTSMGKLKQPNKTATTDIDAI